MKIIVTHEGKQYVNRLLIALDRAGWLKRFYTTFSSNAYLPYFPLLPLIKHQLLKREFRELDSKKIKSIPFLFLIEKVCRTEFKRHRIASQAYDRWASTKLAIEDFDLVISYENSNLSTFKQAKKLGKLTVLDLAQVHHHTIDSIRKLYTIDDFTDKQALYLNQRKQAALNLTDYILTLSSFATKSLVDNGIDSNKIYEVNLGIDIQNFTVVPKPNDSTFRILFVGTISHRKGVDLLLNVFQSLLLPNAELILVGPVSDGANFLARCKGPIRHLPFLHHDELAHYYQQADVFVFPSYLDSWAQVVLEAMACGTPVIVSDNTGAKDAVLQGGGFVIPTGDEAALREKILYFYERRDEVKRLGQEARRIAENYTWERYYQQVTDALTDIARREKIPL